MTLRLPEAEVRQLYEFRRAQETLEAWGVYVSHADDGCQIAEALARVDELVLAERLIAQGEAARMLRARGVREHPDRALTTTLEEAA